MPAGGDRSTVWRLKKSTTIGFVKNVEELEHRQRVAAVFQGFADGLAAASAPAPTVHCTSNTHGSMTTTTCN